MPNDLHSSAFEQASLQGRAILSQSASGEQQVQVSAKNKLAEFALTWLAKIDWMANQFDCIKKFREENAQSLNAFLKVLGSEYGARAGKKASELVPKHGTVPLTARTVHQLTKAAQTFGGSGDARLHTSNVAVKIWPYKGLNHPEHSAVSVNSKDPKYISWWPSGKAAELNQRSFASANTHEQDLISETSDTTASRLQAGRTARQALESAQARGNQLGPQQLEQLEKNAKFDPKANQIFLRPEGNSNGGWGTLPDTYYLPTLGPSVSGKDGKTHSILFGLDPKTMSEAWNQRQLAAGIDPEEGTNLLAQDPNSLDPEARSQLADLAKTLPIGYRMISKEENCAAAALLMLKAGGAELFAPLPKALVSFDPNDASKYAEVLQQKMDNLNREIDGIHSEANQCKGSNPDLEAFAGELKALDETTLLERLSASDKGLEAAAAALKNLPQDAKPIQISASAKKLVESLTNVGKTSGVAPDPKVTLLADETIKRLESKMRLAVESSQEQQVPRKPAEGRFSEDLVDELMRKRIEMYAGKMELD